MGETLPGVTAAGYPRAALEAELASDAFREYRDAVIPYGNRLPLKGRADMLAGKRTSPHLYAVQLLIAGRRAGLPKAWALHFCMWLQTVVKRLWADDHTPLEVLEDREQDAENAANKARLRLAHERTDAARQAWLAAEMNEQAAQLAVLCNAGRM